MQLITMQEKQFLAKAIGIQKENCGQPLIFTDTIIIKVLIFLSN